MSHDPSRKRFLQRVLGLAAAGALAPRTVVAAAREQSNKADDQTVAFRLRPQPLAVARRDGSA